MADFVIFLLVLHPILPVDEVAVAAVFVATFVFLLITGCFWAVEVSLLVVGFAEEDPRVAETFVAPVADLISTA